MIKLGTSDMARVYVGSTEVSKMYLGSELVYQNKLDYVKSGLIFHLDGISKGETSGAWTDLVSGITYTNVSATALTNGWQFNNSVMRSTSYNYLSTNTNYTIEIVLKPESTGAQAIWMPNGNNTSTNGTPLFYYNSGVITFLQRNKSFAITFTANAYHCISLNLDRGLVNGVAKSPQTKTDYWSNQGTYSYIGVRNSNQAYYKGDIYSIRLYNRRLSNAEMLNNQKMDNERFSLGLNL